jgi:hypothetical protein
MEAFIESLNQTNKRRRKFTIMKTGKTLLKALSLGCLAGMLAVGSASAVSYSITTGNNGLTPPYSGPFATLTVTLDDSDTARVTITGLDSGLFHYLIGGQGAIGLNVNGGATFNSSSVTGVVQNQTDGGAPQDPALSQDAPGNLDGMGTFNFILDNVDGYQHAFTSLTFTMDKTSGTWANASDVLTLNGANNLATAHIFVVNADDSWSNTGATGYAATPDGASTIALLGSALVGFGILRRRLGMK